MNDVQQRAAAKKFAEYWKDKGYEKGESQPFWMMLLREVYGIEHVEEIINFEDKVVLDKTSFIDAKIPSTHVLIEQKGLGKNLRKPIKQSDGSLLTPFQQAKRYSIELPYSERPRWIVTCNFSTFHIYDMENPKGEPEVVHLKDLGTEYYRLNFLVNEEDSHIKKEMEVSLQAGELVGQLYDALLEEYHNPEDEETLKNLNILCVRVVFCLYAEDAGLFGKHGMFHDYLYKYKDTHFRDALINLFKVLDQKPEERDPYLEDDLAAFPYVNGGLFENKDVVIPRVNDEIIDIILNKASEGFDWSKISPTIFGAVFESTLNPESRRSGGMHYTSIENIHKVIDPLFLNDLKREFEDIRSIKVERTRNRKLEQFQEKLAYLTFLDPAAGSGNFLTETYISLRKLENEAIKLRMGLQIAWRDVYDPVKVSISQFYGIEINDFAVTVAKTALWIAESQMLKATEDIVHANIEFFPLESYVNIIEGNSLRMDWNDAVPKSKLNYIMGNPPFLGYSMQDAQQKSDLLSIYVDEKGKPYKTAGKIDYVAAWYYKAAKLIVDTNIEVAFVSTNSIVQGEQVSYIWKPLYNLFKIHINFAWHTFKWNSESSKQAAVHCVIISFSHNERSTKYLYFNEKNVKSVQSINPYLIEAEIIFIDSRKKPICNVPLMTTGNRPADGGNLIIEEDEYEEFIRKEPKAQKYIKKLTGASEFINNKKRYCLWLVGADPADIRKMSEVIKRVEACKVDRMKGAPDRQKLADTPMLFREISNPGSYIIIPRVTSEKRRYVPIGYLDGNTIPTDSATIIVGAGNYEFGILTSNVHNSWMRVVAGRLKSDYRYSKDIVYNNFPWPSPSTEQKERIEKSAQAILDARELYPDSSLADLYDDLTMPPELRRAHQLNDRVVMEAYGFNWRKMTESECVAELMKMYQEIVE